MPCCSVSATDRLLFSLLIWLLTIDANYDSNTSHSGKWSRKWPLLHNVNLCIRWWCNYTVWPLGTQPGTNLSQKFTSVLSSPSSNWPLFSQRLLRSSCSLVAASLLCRPWSASWFSWFLAEIMRTTCYFLHASAKLRLISRYWHSFREEFLRQKQLNWEQEELLHPTGTALLPIQEPWDQKAEYNSKWLVKADVYCNLTSNMCVSEFFLFVMRGL